MPKHGKKYRTARELVDRARKYELEEAVALLKGLETAKFDETVEVCMKLGVDPRKGDQIVRGSVVLPHGTGRSVRVAVFAEGEPAEKAVQKPAAAPEAPAAAPAQAKAGEAGRLGDWVVQMGSFSSEQNALRLRERLRKAGFVTQVEKVVVGGKTLFRVRVGPYLERSEADRDKQKISETLKLEGRVLSYP